MIDERLFRRSRFTAQRSSFGTHRVASNGKVELWVCGSSSKSRGPKERSALPGLAPVSTFSILSRWGKWQARSLRTVLSAAKGLSRNYP
jgi:hypothetical protein